MEFFGDRERDEAPRAVAAELAAALARAGELSAGPLRHGALAGCLVRAGELAQGLADAAERDPARAPEACAAMAATHALARALWTSWVRGGDAAAPGPSALAPLAGLGGAPVRIRRPEGYALYTLFPEQYALAARALADGPPPTVIGIRTIGTSLAAIASAGAGAGVPLTVRPTGHPHRKVLQPSGALAAALEGAAGRTFAIVDEGPGLSGSSFGAVAEALLAAGAAPGRIHLLTSHPYAPGEAATPRVQALFAALPRHHVPFERALLAGGPLALTALAEDVIGPVRFLDDLAGGRWRPRVLGAGPWPPSEGFLERRKFLLEGRGGRLVARFAGLGRHGEARWSRAQALADAGVAQPPVAFRHGFLFERWRDDARPLAVAGAPAAAVRDAVRRLLAVSGARPRPPSDGAPPWELLEMARVNAAEALGDAGAEAARALEALLPEVERQAHPVEVDAKLQPWEWLVLPDGRLWKADGVDHHDAHDLAGCQDLLWDVAGAEVELGLSADEALALAGEARAEAPGADPVLLPFYRTCFLALEVGRWTYAARAEPPGPERGRREAALARYRRRLGESLVALRRAAAARGGARSGAGRTAPVDDGGAASGPPAGAAV